MVWKVPLKSQVGVGAKVAAVHGMNHAYRHGKEGPCKAYPAGLTGVGSNQNGPWAKAWPQTNKIE